VRAELRSELLKQRSTLTNLGLLMGMLGLVLFAVVLHGLGLAAELLDSRSEQLMTFGRGEFLGALFAALLGALSITSEIRQGTIRPTFLGTPQRGRVVAAKVVASTLIGAGFGLAASALSAGVGTVALEVRGVDIQLDGGDHALLVAGGAGAAALWAAIGVGVGAVVRSQVPTVVGIAAWLLFVEGLLAGDALDLDVSRFAPGAAAEAISGQDPGTLLAPWLGAIVLVVYVGAAVAAGWAATTRRDVL
jgi:ABC-type transport system involved in multi-copper enzyme maturation permease subunit